MKNEELDKLKAKYWAGKTSIAEERRLKELEADAYFGMLQKPDSKMDWDFDDFMQDLPEEELAQPKDKVRTLPGRMVALLAIAASLILGFFILRPQNGAESDLNTARIAQAQPQIEPLDVQMPKQEVAANRLMHETETEQPVVPPAQRISRAPKQKVSTQPVAQQPEENEFYVEINGERIYDEEKALEVTETALHLATSNLRKGMEGVENIKYLTIEI